MGEHRQLKRVVVTGIGTINAHGLGIDALWNGLLSGQSGIDHVSSFDTTDYPSKVGAEVKGQDKRFEM